MATTPHLGLTLVEQSQAQKEVTVNQAFSRIDALMNTGAESRSVATPPVSPLVGDVYVVGAGATGAWAGKDNTIAYFDAVWRFVQPRKGVLLWIADEAQLCNFDGADWVAAGNNFLGAALVSPVYSTDLVPVVRGGVTYLATVEDCVGYIVAGGGSGGIFNFSIAGNSGLLGVV